MTETQPVPPVPTDLRESGAALFRAIVEDYELRPDEVTVLHSAARLRDVLDDLRSSLEGQPTTVLGSQRQIVIHPIIPEIRQTESALATLLGKLKLHEPVQFQETTTVLRDGPMTRSEVGKLGARARWRPVA